MHGCFTFAAALFRMPKAVTTGSGIRSRAPPILKFCRDRCVCAPQYLQAVGTRPFSPGCKGLSDCSVASCFGFGACLLLTCVRVQVGTLQCTRQGHLFTTPVCWNIQGSESVALDTGGKAPDETCIRAVLNRLTVHHIRRGRNIHIQAPLLLYTASKTKVLSSLPHCWHRGVALTSAPVVTDNKPSDSCRPL